MDTDGQEAYKLRKSSLVSVGLVVLGLVVLLSSATYAVTRLRPLEQEIAAKEGQRAEAANELEQLESENRRLAREKMELREAISADSARVARLRGELTVPTSQGAPAETRRRVANAASASQEAGQSGAAVSASDIPEVPPLPDAIADLYAPDATTRIRAYEVIMAYHTSEAGLISALINYAGGHIRNADGVYNTLVVLYHLGEGRLSPHASEISAFGSQIRASLPEHTDLTRMVEMRTEGTASSQPAR